MPSPDYAQVLLRKAEQDEFVVTALAPDPDAPDAAIGFHAQQPVEKMLKAVLAHHGVRFPWRHDLVELIDLLGENGILFPDALEDVRRLTPFATDFRYDNLPGDPDEALDRAWAQDCIRRTRQWVDSVMPKQT
jgi:HEPN domain-containing protein